MAQMRLLADEIGALHLRRRHAGLDDREVGVELEPERAVALLEAAGRAVDADAGRRDAVRLPRLPHQVPELRALLDRHVELPAELTDVRDPRREYTQRVELDRA